MRAAAGVHAQERASLAAIRCLGASGYAVTATAASASAPGLWSRHCLERRLLAGPTDNLEAFVAGLERILAARRHDLLLAGTDASLFAISGARRRLDGLVGLALAPHEVVQRCLSKVALLETAARCGLAAPQTVLCDSPTEALRAARRLGFAVLIKPDAVICVHGPRLVRRASVLVGDERALSWGLCAPGPWLVQRYLHRPLVSLAGVATSSGLAALVAARYVRLWPVAAGDGSFVETFKPSDDVVTAVQRLLALLGWVGIFQLELADLGDRLAALDFNPRPYGSMAIAQAAGVPLSSIWCRLALDGRVDGDRAPLIGRAMVRYRVEDADARALGALLRSRRWREAAAAIAPRRRVAHAYFKGSDPLPLAARALQLAGRTARRATAR
jgi:predicted ATP-grasp superfamily ATP-dependent carboligase